MKIQIFSLFFLLFLSGCSNWALKERCEQTNWFEYSRDLANSGKYLEEDGFIKECKDVDRTSAVQLDQGFKSGRERYCTYESFLRNGESGEPVNFKMCDNLVLYNMQERYGSGLKKFCTDKVGYTFGASGKVYKNVCFKSTEEKFLPQYYKGRKEFLTKQIAQFTEDIENLTKLQTDLNSQIELISSEIRSLPHIESCTNTSHYNHETKKIDESRTCTEDYGISSRRSSLYSQISPLRIQYEDHGRILVKESKALIEARSELTKIPVEI